MKDFIIIAFIVLGWLVLGLLGGIVWSIGLLLIKREPDQRIDSRQWFFIFIMFIGSGPVGLFEAIRELRIAVRNKRL